MYLQNVYFCLRHDLFYDLTQIYILLNDEMKT